jgi:hypothetical protein
MICLTTTRHQSHSLRDRKAYSFSGAFSEFAILCIAIRTDEADDNGESALPNGLAGGQMPGDLSICLISSILIFSAPGIEATYAATAIIFASRARNLAMSSRFSLLSDGIANPQILTLHQADTLRQRAQLPVVVNPYRSPAHHKDIDMTDPIWLARARKYLGLREIPEPKHNSQIVNLVGGHQGVLCGTGRNDTLSGWPPIFTNQVYMLPSKRRDVREEFRRDGQSGIESIFNGVAQFQSIPEDDDGSEQI